MATFWPVFVPPAILGGSTVHMLVYVSGWTPPYVWIATAPDRQHVVVEFSEVVYSADLLNPGAWAVAPVGPGAAVVVTGVVQTGAKEYTLTVVTAMTSTATYEVTAPATVKNGASQAITAAGRIGTFVVPDMIGIVVAEAIGAHQVRVEFDSPYDPISVIDPAGWVVASLAPTGIVYAVTGVAIDGGPHTEVVIDVSPGMTPGAVYRVVALTAASAASGILAVPNYADFLTGAFAMSGYTLPPSESFVGVTDTADIPSLKIYPMLQKALRELDAAQGNEMVKRFLQRPEMLWALWMLKLSRIPWLHDPTRCPPQALDHLKAWVGFGDGEPGQITADLSDDDKRRLIKIAVPYWKRRGRRGALADTIRVLASGISPAIDDWFYVRMIVGEVLLGLAGVPGDPWLLYSSVNDVPAGMPDGEVAVSIRIPDLGTLDRDLAIGLCSIARPVGERYEIAFVDFLDTFVDDRLAHWETRGAPAGVWGSGSMATTPPTLPGLDLAVGSRERAIPPLADAWHDYSWTVYLAWATDEDVGLRFLVTDDDNYYEVRISPPNAVRLYRIVGGAPILIAANLAVPLATPATRGVRVEHAWSGLAGDPNQIRVYVDGNLAIDDFTDSTYRQGTIEVEALTGPVRLCRTELFQRPLTIEVIP